MIELHLHLNLYTSIPYTPITYKIQNIESIEYQKYTLVIRRNLNFFFKSLKLERNNISRARKGAYIQTGFYMACSPNLIEQGEQGDQCEQCNMTGW